jgi:hypothetical protein
MYINKQSQPNTWQFNWQTNESVFSAGCWNVRVYLPATGQVNRPAGFKVVLK